MAFGRRAAVAVFSIAIAAAVGMTAAVAYNENLRREAGFRRASEEIARSLQSSTDAYLDTLYATRSLLEAHPDIDHQLFTRFATPLLAMRPALRAVEWVPRVPADERAELEHASGIAGQKIAFREIAPDGGLVDARERSEYHPVLWVAPRAGNEAAVGLDVSADATRYAALARARDTGRPSVSGPLRLVQVPEDPSGYIVVVPVYWQDGSIPAQGPPADGYRGSVLGVFRLNELVAGVLERAANFGIDVTLLDGGWELARSLEAPLAHAGRSARFVAPYRYETEISVADRGISLVALPTPFYLRERSSPVFLVTVAGAGVVAVSLLLYLLLIRRQFLEQDALATALRESETRYRTIVENAPEGLFVYDVDRARFTDGNERGLAMLKTTREDLLTRPLWAYNPRIQPDGRESAAAAREMVDQALAGETLAFPWVYMDATGRSSPSEVRLTRLPVAGRNLIAASVVDTSERRRSELRQLMMARELDHRVKNNLATVLSIAEQTGAESTSFEEFRSAFSARVRAMARVHEQLASSHWEGADLGAVLRLMLAPFGDQEGRRVRIEGPYVVLTAAAASALSLVFHELGDNAAKYGALAVPQGSLRIRWAVRLEKDLRIVWEERDGGSAASDSSPGFGMRLVHGLVAHELGGAVDVRYVGGNMICEMTVPAEHFSLERSQP